MSKGFTNLGNTCYMNSALQCLCHLEELSYMNNNFMLDCTKKSPTNDYSLMSELIKLQKYLWKDNNKGVVSTKPLFIEYIKRCQKEKLYFESFSQNDCQDFLNNFIDLLHGSIKRKVNIIIKGKPKNNYDLIKIKGINEWKTFFENNYSYIIKTFYSQLLSITSCPKCEYITTNHEPIMTITLTLEDDYNNVYDTIYDCLDEFIKPNILDKNNKWKCDKCKELVCPQKKVNFWNLSPVIIILIKQFGLNRKINKHIEFPEYLNMEKYCINSKKNSTNYKLNGTCIHKGGLNGGHYYAMCYNHITNKWNIHNDITVEETTINDVLNETPYCFFYSRV